MLRMMLGGMPGMIFRMHMMPVSGMGMMRGFVMIAFLIMLGGFMMMLGRLFMMRGCVFVMICVFF